MKIGLIQNIATAGDFSTNLRLVVQGARACTDAEADLLVASAQAIDGALPGGLSRRSAFLLQSQAALRALAAELSKPLILASYAAAPGAAASLPRPFLLKGGEVLPLENHRVLELEGISLFLDVGEFPSPPPAGTACHGILHLPTAAWHPGLQQAWVDAAQQELRTFAPELGVLVLQGVGSSVGQAIGGGSVGVAAGGVLRLPVFAPAEALWPEAPAIAPANDARDQVFASAIDSAAGGDDVLEAQLFCLRELVSRGGYAAVAVAEGLPHAELLAALTRLAVGEELLLPLPASPGQEMPAQAAALFARAEAAEALLLSGLSRSAFLLGDYAAPAALSGHYAPLADMLPGEIARLQQSLNSRLSAAGLAALPAPEPELAPREEALLRLLVDENRSIMELCATRGLPEHALRAIWRRLRRAAARLDSRPPFLLLRPGAPPTPPLHMLNE
ncbi:MAG: hypothetical protein J1E42_00545 [Akkermansiaceae bacterium]|nr:hypothetical protein [Akkermansiaceae bacterium]